MQFYQTFSIKLYKTWHTDDSYTAGQTIFTNYRGVWYEVVATPHIAHWIQSSVGEDYVAPINNFLLTFHLLGISL